MSLELTQLVGFGAGAGARLAIFDSGGTSGSGSSSTIVYTVPAGGIPGGSTAFVAISGQNSVSISSVADSKGNTWAVDSTSTGGIAGGIARGTIVAPLVNGDTITVTLSGACFSRCMRVFYATGLIASPLDKTADNFATSTSTTTSTAATTQAAELVIAAIGLETSTITGGETGWTTLGSDVTSGAERVHTVYKIVAATGVQTYAPTISASNAWHIDIVTLKAA